MLSKILVAIDGSEHAQRALDFACGLAERFDSELLLVSVAPPTELPEALKQYANAEHLDATTGSIYLAIAENMLESARTHLDAKALPKISTQVRFGDPAHEIVEAAGANGVDAIVLGSRGLGKLKGLLVGSVSHKVNSVASCTCIIVH